MAARGALARPSPGVEQREPFLVQPVAALDARAPPLAEVATGPETRTQLVGMFSDPAREAHVVGLGRDPARARTGNHEAIVADKDLGIRAVDLLANHAAARQP